MIEKKQQWIKEKREKKVRHERSLFLRALFYFLLISFLIVFFYALFFSGFLKISKIALRGTEDLKREDILGVVNDSLQGDYWGIVEKNNFALVFEGGLEKKILDKFGKIRGVKVEKIFPDSLNIIIDERKSLLIWSAGDEKFILDENGKAYEKADFNSKLIEENNLVEIKDESNKVVSIGEKVLNSDYINFSLAIRDKIEKEADLLIENQYRTSSRIADEVTIRTQEGWDIFLSSQLDLDYSARMLKTFLEKQVNQEQRKELEYVDLRIEKKIYYKMKKKEGENDKGEEDGKDEDDDADNSKN
jgi:cell division septal protein FtsQ